MHGWYYSQISAWLSMFILGLCFTFFLHPDTWSKNEFVITFTFVFANIWRSLQVEFNFEDLLRTHISQKYNCCRSSECEGQIEIFQMNWYIMAWMECINIEPYNFWQWFRPDQTRKTMTSKTIKRKSTTTKIKTTKTTKTKTTKSKTRGQKQWRQRQLKL